MQDKKRNLNEYATYQVYPEIQYVNGLQGEELLGLGMVYNFTSKNTTSFLIGKNVNGVTKAFNLNADTFKVKRITRTDVKRILDSLVDKGWLYEGTKFVERKEFRGQVTTKELTPVFISNMGMTKIREAIRTMNNPQSNTPLF